MRQTLLSMGILALLTREMKSQIVIDTVSVGAGYANHKFYSLQNDEQGFQSKDNWDLGFEITGYSAAIIANTQRSNFAVYKAPYSIANYNAIDTAGINSWSVLYNSDETWSVGAFNRGANAANPNDLGWGVYDQSTHYILGDSCYVVKVSASIYKKLKIVSLIGGIYTFEYANINGTASQTATISKSAYTGKNFVYYDLSSNAALDREPTAASWDLMFGRYTAFVPSGSLTVPYAVVGVLANKNVYVHQENDVTNPSAFSTWAGNVFSTNISTIGHDWKAVDLNTSQWKVVNDTIYFVADRSGNIWKMRFSAFGGTSNGNYVFSKEKISAVGITDMSGKEVIKFTIYPNPSTANNSTLLFSSAQQLQDITVAVTDINGRSMSIERVKIETGLDHHTINTEGWNAGVYFITVSAAGNTSVQKLIKQ